MKVLVLGAGMMGRAIAYDLSVYSGFEKIIISDNDTRTRNSAKKFLKGTNVDVVPINVDKLNQVKNYFQKVDVVVSAVPYRFNF